MSSQNSILEMNDISKVYAIGTIKVHALSNINLTISRGKVIVILGPSGSGKTTLLNLIGSIDVPSNGTIRVFDEELTHLNRKSLAKFRRDHIGFIFQFFNLIPSLTASENIEYGLQIKGEKNTKIKALDSLKQVGLLERANHFPSELSGGEQQRLAIARAIAKSPEIILADEPTGELDFETGIKILEILHDLTQGSNPKTVLIVTHNAEIARIADRTIRLRSGKIISDIENTNPDAPDDLKW